MTAQFERWRRTRLANGDLGPYLEVTPGREYVLTGQAGSPLVTLLFTANFPLTDGSALGRLAGDPASVQVTVDGVLVPVWGVDALPGAVYVRGSVAPGAEVRVSYAWTPRLTVSFARLNDPNLVLNQGGGVNLGVGLNEVRAFAPPASHEQAPLFQHRYSALQRAYSSLLNDPLLLRFNAGGSDLYGASRLEAAVPPVTLLSFEANTQPTDPATGPWEHVGPALGVLNGSGGYVLTDAASGSPGGPAASSVNYFRRREERAFSSEVPPRVVCNVRWSLVSHTPQDDWTGWAWGWADPARLIMASALRVPGTDWLTLGLLSSVGDEAVFRSYAGREVVLVDRTGAPDGSGRDALSWPNAEAPPLRPGQRISLDWGAALAEVLAVQDPVTAGSPDGTSWRVILTAPLPMMTAGAVLTLHAELPLQAAGLRSFRLERSEGPDGEVVLYDVARTGAGPLVRIPASQLAVAPEVQGSLVRAGGDFFWGCLGRQALTFVLVDFVRWEVRSARSAQASFQFFRAAEGSVFPPAEPDSPWTLEDNEGWAALLPGGFLRLQAATDLLPPVEQGRGWAYSRQEPLFTSQAGSRLRARLRVDSWAEGSPAGLVLDDGTRQLRLALWEAPDPVAAPRWADCLGGGLLPDEAGWADGWGPLMSRSILDDRLVLRWAGSAGPPSAAIKPATNLPPGPQESWTLAWRFRWEALPVLTAAPWERAPFWAGLEDGELSLYVTVGRGPGGSPWVLLCARDGSVFTQGGSPLGGPFDWTGPAPAAQGSGTRDVELRLLRNGDWLQVWADAGLVVNLDLTLIPALQPSDVTVPSTRLYVGSAAPAALISDYLFSHSNLHFGPSAVGLRMDPTFGPDDVRGYELRASPPWLGVFLELEVLRNPVGQVQVRLNGSLTWDLDYDQLPPSELSSQEVPVVRWGTFSGRTLSLAVWDFLRFEAYSLGSPSAASQPRPNTNNWALQMTSGEPLFDVMAGRGQAVLSPFNRTPSAPLINLADLERNIGTVLAVTDLAGATPYGFFWSGDQADPLRLTAPLPPNPLGLVLITFLERTGPPWTDAYLLDRPALTRLEEGTPPVPLSQVGQVRAEAVSPPPLTNPPAPLPDNVFQGEDGLLVEYILEPAERAYYEDLRVLTTVVPRPDADALEVACGSLVALDLSPYQEDPYSLQPDAGLGPVRFWTWNLSSWNGPDVWAPALVFGRDYNVGLSLSWVEEEVLPPVSEVQATGALTDYAGGTYWNSPAASWNGSPGPGVVAFTWNDPNLTPTVTPLTFTVP